MTQSSGKAWFRPRRLPGRLGPVGISRLLVLQLIQVGLFVVLVQGFWAGLLGGVVGALSVGLTFARWRGRWVTEVVVLWLRFLRRRGVAGGQLGDPRLAALGELVPDLVVEDVAGGKAAAKLGMGSDGAGWFAVVAVEPNEAGVDPPVPLAALARIAAEAGLAGVVVQVVSQVTPAAKGRERSLWVAVRLDADALANSVVDDAEREVDVPAVLAELTRRVRRALTRPGLDARVLDADGLISALVHSCDLGSSEPARPGQVPPLEEWAAWHSHRLTHRCFWLQVWPDSDRGTALLDSLSELPGAQVSIALLLEPRYEGAEADLRCLIRIAAPPDRSHQLSDLAERLAARYGGELSPLDGEQALAVYGSAPSGGGPR